MTDDNFCSVHKVAVSAKHTCDSFEMKAALKNDAHCGNCIKFETSNCAHPEKSAEGMLCTSWAPQATA